MSLNLGLSDAATLLIQVMKYFGQEKCRRGIARVFVTSFQVVHDVNLSRYW